MSSPASAGSAQQIELERKGYATLGRAASCLRAFSLLCRHNSDYADADEAKRLTPFHSVSEPPIPLAAYVARIMKHTECGPDGVLLGIRLAGRYCKKTKMLPSSLSAHRLLAVTLVLATKAHYDKFRSNRTAARAAGLRLQELNLLEVALFRSLRYQAVVFQVEVDNMVEGSEAALQQLAQLSPSGIPTPAPGSPALPDEVHALLSNAFNGVLSKEPGVAVGPVVDKFIADCNQDFLEMREEVRAAVERQNAASAEGGSENARLSEAQLRIAAGGSAMFAVRSRLAAMQDDDAVSAASSAVHSTTSQQAAATRFHARVLGLWGTTTSGEARASGTRSSAASSNSDHAEDRQRASSANSPGAAGAAPSCVPRPPSEGRPSPQRAAN